MKDFKNVKRRIRNKRTEASAGSSSGGGMGSAIASGAKAVGSAVLDAAKEAGKEALRHGASAVVKSFYQHKKCNLIFVKILKKWKEKQEQSD